MNHTEPTGKYQPRSVGTMFKWSIGELLPNVAFVHHNDKGHDALKRYAALKGFDNIVKRDDTYELITDHVEAFLGIYKRLFSGHLF